ncbi:retrotransposon protein, putative, unclassified [Tanacetum coccineum]
MDGMTKSALWYYWVKGEGNNELMGDIESSDEEWEEFDYGNPPNTDTNYFFKPIWNAQERCKEQLVSSGGKEQSVSSGGKDQQVSSGGKEQPLSSRGKGQYLCKRKVEDFTLGCFLTIENVRASRAFDVFRGGSESREVMEKVVGWCESLRFRRCMELVRLVGQGRVLPETEEKQFCYSSSSLLIDPEPAKRLLKMRKCPKEKNQRAVNVVGARENVGTPVVQKSGIQCYNCKEYGHVSRECQKPKRVKDAAYHKEKMLLCKQEEVGVQLNAEQADWKDDTIVTPDSVDNSGPIFDDEPMHKVQNNNDNYNVFAMENEHPEQPESSNDIYLTEQGDTNITIDSLDICYDRAQDDQDETDDLDQERDLLASFNQ